MKWLSAFPGLYVRSAGLDWLCARATRSNQPCVEYKETGLRRPLKYAISAHSDIFAPETRAGVEKRY